MVTTTERDVFGALADPTRRQMLDRLRDEGGLTVTALSEGLPITRQAATKHLDTLVAAGLVQVTRQGRERHHDLIPRGLRQAHLWLTEHVAAWDRRLERLVQHLEKEE